MPEKFQNKYRIPSVRLQNWDYGSTGLYFVTIIPPKRTAPALQKWKTETLAVSTMD